MFLHWATEPVALVPAAPNWAARGDQDRDHLDTVLTPWLIARVEHVSSTSIPDLPAKPIIDLQALVADLADAGSIAAILAPHQWHYVGPDLDQRPWRRFFVKVTGDRRSAHLHVMTSESSRWHEQITFRDALRADPALTADYAALKRVLAAEHTADREAYSEAKTSFIRTVLDRPA
jgi:GrpB-like predicted nucleotidyltransferase (UPF0157 family)